MAKTLQEIAELLKGMKFRRKLFGVDEADVWRQLEGLQREYQAVFDAQQAVHEALLKEREDMIAQLLAKTRRPAPPEPSARTGTPAPAAAAASALHGAAAPAPPGQQPSRAAKPGGVGQTPRHITREFTAVRPAAAPQKRSEPNA